PPWAHGGPSGFHRAPKFRSRAIPSRRRGKGFRAPGRIPPPRGALRAVPALGGALASPRSMETRSLYHLEPSGGVVDSRLPPASRTSARAERLCDQEVERAAQRAGG